MPENVLATEYVEFVAKGLDEVSLVTEEYRRRLEQADTAANLLKKTLASGTYEDIARKTHEAAQKMRELTERAREVEYAVKGGLSGEALDRFNAKLEQTRHEADLLQHSLSSGMFQGFATQMAAETKRLEALKAQATAIQNQAMGYRPAARLGTAIAIARRAPTQEMRWADEYRQKVTAANLATEKSAFMARMQYGALGASLIQAGNQVTTLSHRMNVLGTVGGRAWAMLAGGGAFAVAGLARQGFAGTVELHQFGFAIQLIAREVANLFVPALRTVTGWLQRISAYLRSLDGDQQQQIRKWGLMAAGATAFVMVLPRVIGMGGSLLGTLGQLGPMLGTIAPGFAGSAAAAGPWGMVIAAGLAMAAAGFVVAYARSAEFRAEVAMTVGNLEDLYDAARPFIELALDVHVMTITSNFKLLNYQLETTVGMLKTMLRLYDSLPATMKAGLAVANPLFAGLNRTAGGETPGGSGRRRDEVGIMQTGFEGLESTFDRMQEAVLRAESGAGDPAQDTADNTGAIAENTGDIKSMLEALFSRVTSSAPSLAGRR